MTNEINKILLNFQHCFNRVASFNWFVIIIMGFILKLDHTGITSFIRWLGLDPSLYTALLSFFRASSWSLELIQQKWWEIVFSLSPILKIGNYYLIAGDGIKVSKEAKKMPGVKKLHQESDNSGKATYIYGHHHGVLGILAGWINKKIFCIPLCAELHEGIEKLRKLQGKSSPIIRGKEKVSIATLMASMVVDVVKNLNKKCLVALDAYFAVGPVFLLLKELVDKNKERLVHIVTRAKNNIVAYTEPPERKTSQQGRPRKYGEKIKLRQLFSERHDEFQTITIQLYNQIKTISFLCIDLLWRPIQEKVRFVLVIDGSEKFILICSNLELSPQNIIKAYSFRFKIEVNFKVLKHIMGVFFCHFWTHVWPKIGKKSQSELLCLDVRAEKLIAQTTNAIEGFVNFGCIATGILQIISLNFYQTIWQSSRRWLRTLTSVIPSEETVKAVIQEEHYFNFLCFRNTAIYQIIMAKRNNSHSYEYPETG